MNVMQRMLDGLKTPLSRRNKYTWILSQWHAHITNLLGVADHNLSLLGVELPQHYTRDCRSPLESQTFSWSSPLRPFLFVSLLCDFLVHGLGLSS